MLQQVWETLPEAEDGEATNAVRLSGFVRRAQRVELPASFFIDQTANANLWLPVNFDGDIPEEGRAVTVSGYLRGGQTVDGTPAAFFDAAEYRDAKPDELPSSSLLALSQSGIVEDAPRRGEALAGHDPTAESPFNKSNIVRVGGILVAKEFESGDVSFRSLCKLMIDVGNGDPIPVRYRHDMAKAVVRRLNIGCRAEVVGRYQVRAKRIGAPDANGISPVSLRPYIQAIRPPFAM